MPRKDGSRPSTSVQGTSTPPRASYQQHISHENSPPHTPPSQVARTGKGKGAGGVRAPRNRPALRDTFGDQARETESDHTRNRSNSHELSWSPNTNNRASVVDNMLASLDQFSTTTSTTTHQTSSNTHTSTSTTVSRSNDYDPFSSNSRFASLPAGRARSHTISSSVSSDASFSFHAESPKSRGHRSNSSSNFQSSLGRIDSVRLADGLEERPNIPEVPSASKAKGSYAGARKGSKSSGSSSVDFGAMSTNTRWHRGPDRRSASFDHGYQRPAFAPPMALAGASPLTIGQQEALFYDSLDAAPTPTVPVGPRHNDSRNASPARSSHYRPGSSLSGNYTAPARRRGSIRSPMAIFHRPEKSEALEPGDPEKDATLNLLENNSGHDNILTPLATKPPGKSRALHNQTGSASNSTNVAKERERPGFFKRVFGSSRSNTQQSYESTPSHSSNPSINNSTAQHRNENIPPGYSSRKTATPVQTTPNQKTPTNEKMQAKDQPPHPLNKKTSFFRRRKKSISESPAVPVPALDLQQHVYPDQQVRDQSSVSSLRQVMGPYIDSPVRVHGGSQGMSSAPIEGNHPRREEYYGRSTIRPVHHHEGSDRTTLHSVSRISSRTSEGQLEPPPSDIINQPEPDRQPPAPPKSADNPPDRPADLPRKIIVDADLVVQSAPPTAAATDSSVKTPLKAAPANPPRTSSRKLIVVPDKEVSEHIMPKASPSRLWIQPDGSEEELVNQKKVRSRRTTQEADPKASTSTVNSEYESANSKRHSPKVPSNTRDRAASEPLSDVTPDPATEIPTTLVKQATLDEIEPTEDDKLQAEKLFAGESSISMADAAAWLGEIGPDRARVRMAFMNIFDWQNMSILAAMRSFCTQLRLKGESQQVDRLLDSLSARWCACNPENGFKAADVVHTICYSILLLNTDLYLADIDQKMTRGQFIKNTMPTIRRVVADAAPNSFSTARASMLPPPKPPGDGYSTPLESPTFPDPRRPTNRVMTRSSDHSGNDTPITTDPDQSFDDCGPLVKAPFNGRQSAWEAQVEIVLKNFYFSIRHERLPLVRSEEPPPVHSHPSSTSLSVATGNMLRRTNSMLSKAGSESLPNRGRALDSRMGSRWSSKTRSRPRLYQASLGRASRTSFDDDMSAISPSASSMWSKYSIGKTQTSMSVNSYTSDYPPRGDYQRSIGFANALSQAIIREDASGTGEEETMRVVPLLEDESLELAGAPWAKEGILKHKHHLEAVDKKAKDRNWNECFAVVDKGWMRLFQFNVNARSMRQKARNQKMGGVVGGGNWHENAEPLGKFSLRQTLASSLPPPGYSRARPHVFALSLPNGAVHLFQAGTPDIVREFVTTANYWSARISKEPLVGGVSNIEYGWSESVINMALVDNRPPSSMTGPRPSLQNSIRSSVDQSSSRPKLPGDRIVILDWTPPTVSMMESQLLEVDQLRALSNYVKNIEEELSKHNELRPAIQLAFSPRHHNAGKAMNNWERKSSYLLREIVKFTTYIDSLQQAQVTKDMIYKEREEYEQEKQKGYDVDVDTSASKGKEIEVA